jgi:transmembrane sensor
MKRSAESAERTRIEADAALWVARRDVGLSPPEHRELEEWLAGDFRHRAEFRYYQSAWGALARPSQLGAGESFERCLALLDRRRRRRRLAGACGAVAALLLVTLATWNLPWRTPQSTGGNAVVLVPTSKTLPDGSVVELKGRSRIEVDYTSSTRRVLLKEGEAHFIVQDNKSWPFVVSASGVLVRAVGTAFCVQLGVSTVEVLVTEGEVAVNRAATNPVSAVTPSPSTPLARVEAGKHVVVDIAPSNRLTEINSVPTTALRERLAWRSPRLEFTRTSLADAVALLNKHAPASAAQLVVGDSAAAAMAVTGVFGADNTEAFVYLLEETSDIKAERSGNTIVLRRPSEEPAAR